MRYPPRLGHLATRNVLVARLAPTYAAAHSIEDEEANSRLEIALQGRFLEDILASTWSAMLGNVKRLDEAGLLEKVARSLRDRPERRGKEATLNPSWSAFLVLTDIAAGTAGETARRVMETDAGRVLAQKGLVDAGQFLAHELTK